MTVKSTKVFALMFALLLIGGFSARAQRQTPGLEPRDLQFGTWTDTTGKWQTDFLLYHGAELADGRKESRVHPTSAYLAL